MAEGDHDRIGIRNELDRLNDADPFVPFEIVVTSGDRFLIDRPDMVLPTKDLLLIYARSDGLVIIRMTELVFIRTQVESRDGQSNT